MKNLMGNRLQAPKGNSLRSTSTASKRKLENEKNKKIKLSGRQTHRGLSFRLICFCSFADISEFSSIAHSPFSSRLIPIQLGQRADV